MARNRTLYLAFLVILILGGLHYLASVFYFYWSVWWFDYLMHFLAGLGGSLATIWVLGGLNSRVQYEILAFLCVMIVGVVWEIFEVTYDIAYSTEGYRLDTTNDLVMDALGALTAILIARRLQSS